MHSELSLGRFRNERQTQQVKQFLQSDDLAGRMQRCHGRRRGWQGTVYRSASPRYANRDDFMTGAGARTSGARWNPPRSFATLYASLDPETAISESLAHHRYFRFPVLDALPRTLAAIRVELQHVLDLTDAATRRILKVTQNELIDDDWRKANRKNRESLTQAIGRLAWHAEWEAILVPSAAAEGKANLIIFPGNLLPPKSYLLLVNRDRLPEPTA